MGTNSKSSDDSYVVAPSVAVDPTTVDEGTPTPAGDDAHPPSHAEINLVVAMDHLGTLASGSYWPEEDLSPEERYEAFVQETQKAKDAIAKMQADGASQEEIDAHLKALKAQSLAYLTSLDDDELRYLAYQQGFQHPDLVGLSGKGNHPLVHWLDPAYDDNIPSKNGIQAAALDRYEQLLAGGTVNGLTLGDLHELEGAPPPVPMPDGAWTATPEQVAAAVEAVDAALAALPDGAQAAPNGKGQAIWDLVQAEKQLATAYSPDQAEELAQAQAQAKIKIDEALNGVSIGQGEVWTSVLKSLGPDGLSDPDVVSRLQPREFLALVRATTSEADKEALREFAAHRQGQVDAMNAALPVHQLYKADKLSPLELPKINGDADVAQSVAAWAMSTGELHDKQLAVAAWSSSVIQVPSMDSPLPGANLGPAGSMHHTVDPDDLTQALGSWAQKQTPSDLRLVATELGMPNPDSASKANLRKYIAAKFNPALDTNAINASVADTAAKKTPSPAPASGLASDEAVQALKSKLAASPAANADSSPTSNTGLTDQDKIAAAVQMGATPEQAKKLAQAPAAAPKPAKPVKSAKPGSFVAKAQALIAGLQQAKATAQDVPARIDAGVVGAWDFGGGTPANLGGTYAKTVHSAPDGSSWLFKADHHGGAIAQAEATASHALSLGGIAAVPVYFKDVGGQVGSVQPLLKGATTFSADAKSWSQADVDAIVRSHVGSWLVGDHDGHQANVLRTASGGLVHIDRGQAFKHFGQDKLSVGYAPSGGGSFAPVHQRLYSTALAGGLADGVKVNPAVAHPIIKNFEAIPDTQWRSVLHASAHAGAAPGSGAHWVPEMRSRAAAKHGIAADLVTSVQIADAFLDHAVERKKQLRTAFADFFVTELKMPTAASLKHGAA